MSSIEEISEYTSINLESSGTSISKDQKKTENPVIPASTSKSIVFSSCEDGDLSNEESKNKEWSDLSSTNEIIIHEFNDNSRGSVIDRKSNRTCLKKRKSDCSKLGFYEKMKVFKGDESLDESFESICYLPRKVRMKRIDSDFPTRKCSILSDESHSSYKSRIGRTSSTKCSIVVSDADRSRYSDSIFKVFLKPLPEKIVKKKLVPVDQSSKNRRSAVSSRRNASSPRKTSSAKVPEHEQIVLSSEDAFVYHGTEALSDDAASGLSSCTDTTDECGDFSRNSRFIRSPSEMAMKSVGSKRSVHWEDQVTTIQRSNSSDNSQIWNDEYGDNPMQNYETLDYIGDKWCDNEKKLFRNNCVTKLDEKVSKNIYETKKKKKSTGTKNENTISYKHVTSKNTINKRSSRKVQNNRPRECDPGDEVEMCTKNIHSFKGNQKESSSVDKITKNCKRTPENQPGSETISSNCPLECIKGSLVGSLKRGTSSPNISSKHGTSNIVNWTSAMEFSNNQDDGVRQTPYTGLDSSRLSKKNCQRNYQSGEKDFERESECYYEDVRDQSYVVQEPPVKIQSSSSKETRPNSLKCSVDDPSNTTTESLIDCLITMKKLSSQSQDTRPEHIKIIQEIQSNIVNIKEQLEKNKPRNIIQLNNTESRKVLINTSNEKKKSSNRFNITKKTSKDSDGVSKKKTSKEDISHKGKTEKTIVCDKLDSKSNSKPNSANSEKSLKITEAWKKTEIAITKRRDNILAELYGKRSIEQCKSQKESLDNSKLLTKVREKRNHLKTENEVAQCILNVQSESVLPEVSSDDPVQKNNNFEYEEDIIKKKTSKSYEIGIIPSQTIDVYRVSTMENKKNLEEELTKDEEIVENASNNIQQSNESPDNEEDSVPEQENVMNNNTGSIIDESAKDEPTSPCKQFVLVSLPVTKNDSIESIELGAACQSHDNHFVSLSSESESGCEEDIHVDKKMTGSRVSGKETITYSRPPSRKPFYRISDSESEESTISVTRVPSHLPARSRNTPESTRTTQETTSEKKEPPQPRMYSTLKESIANTNKKQDVKEYIQSAMKDFNAPPSVSKAKSTSCYSNPKECSPDSIKPIKELRFKSNESTRKTSKPTLSILENRLEWVEMVKIGQKTLKHPRKETFCFQSTLISKKQSNSKCNKPTPSLVSKLHGEKVNDKTSDNRSSNESKLRSASVHIPLRNKPLKTHGMTSHSPIDDTLRRSAYSEKLRRNRLSNYVPPWEQVNLTPNANEKNKQEILKEPKRTSSNPQSTKILHSSKSKRLLPSQENRRKDISEHSSCNSVYDTADSNEAQRVRRPTTRRDCQKNKEAKPEGSSFDGNSHDSKLEADNEIALSELSLICNSTQTNEQSNANNMKVNVSIRTSYSRSNLKCNRYD